MVDTRRVRGRAVQVSLGAVAVGALVGLPLFGVHRFHQWQERPVESVRIAGEVTVAGFERIGVVTVSPGDDLPEGLAYFAGPVPYPDPVAGVSVPSISLGVVDRVRAGAVEDIRIATGARPDRCSASVYFNPAPLSYGAGKEEVQAKLAAARSAGNLVILVRVRGCGI